MDIFWHSLEHAVIDTLYVIPVLYLAYLLVSYFSHNDNEKFSKILHKTKGGMTYGHFRSKQSEKDIHHTLWRTPGAGTERCFLFRAGGGVRQHPRPLGLRKIHGAEPAGGAFAPRRGRGAGGRTGYRQV